MGASRLWGEAEGRPRSGARSPPLSRYAASAASCGCRSDWPAATHAERLQPGHDARSDRPPSAGRRVARPTVRAPPIHRDRPSIARCRPARRRSAAEARCRARGAARAALPMPALRRTHDRHRGVRTRLQAKVAADTNCERHVMSQDRLSASPLSRSAAPARRRRRSLSAKPRQSTIRPPLDTPHAATEIPIARFQDPFRALSRPPGASFAPTVIIGAKSESP